MVESVQRRATKLVKTIKHAPAAPVPQAPLSSTGTSEFFFGKQTSSTYALKLIHTEILKFNVAVYSPHPTCEIITTKKNDVKIQGSDMWHLQITHDTDDLQKSAMNIMRSSHAEDWKKLLSKRKSSIKHPPPERGALNIFWVRDGDVPLGRVSTFHIFV